MSSLKDRLRHLYDGVSREALDMHVYQREAVDFLHKNPFSALFIDTGMGKTVVSLTLIDRLLMRGEAERILIIAPVRVAAQTWPTEIKEWRHLCYLEPTVLRAEDDDPEVTSAGQAAANAFRESLSPAERKALKAKREMEALFVTTKEEQAKVREIPTAETERQKAETLKKEEIRLRKARNGATLHIINREAIEWLVDLYSEWVNVRGKMRRKIVGWPYDTVIIDESSSFKDHKSYRFQALVQVRTQGFIKRLHELTATPAAESYLGLWPQLFLLDRGERLGRNITAYRDDYFHANPYSRFQLLINKGAKEIIADRIGDICLTMLSPDYLDEEPPLFLPRKLSFTPTQLEQYKHFERQFVLTLEDGEKIEAETAAALSSKLLQLASGAVYNKDGEAREVHNHKVEDLKELVEELDGEPLLVAYWYKSSLKRLRKAFPKAVVMDESGKCITPWNKGEIKMLLVHPAGVGHGLNMQYGPGHDIYFFDQCWSYELYYQLYRRLHRQGQKKRVRVHLAQMIGSNDEIVSSRLLDKKDAQDTLFDRIKRLWRAAKLKAVFAANDEDERFAA